ncbi:stalk domain-containing protein [Anaerotalea alkaliphila]|uniref:Copper amine oxidase-like N-terminal domain-containing protein n=1 Tax=Anaerotalea alkaliphila TaxID=2662126 RepID=A0A7X5HXH8_9FIRM|nr:stalk domain-containing protein [Anaerotalea alkaliphila]NDL68452.1 hypothetical protein [Anaerotalea alkaliphila]
MGKHSNRLNRLLSALLAVMMIATPFLGLNVFAATTGTTYYVSTTGNDANTGTTATSALKTFKKALEKAVAGDTILAKGGTYSEKIVVSKSGTAGAPITIKNAPGETPVLDGTGMTPTWDGMVTIENKSNVTIEGFEIRNYKATKSSSVPMGISVYGAGANIQLLNNRIHAIENPTGNAHGIRVFGTNGSTPVSNIVVNGNHIYNCKLGQSEALVLNGNVDGFKVNYNVVHDNDNIGIDFIGYEGTAPANDNTRNGECVGNTVYNISSAGNPTYGGDACAGGIYVDGGMNILIDRNTVKNCDIGIEVATERGPMTRNITVTNNLVTDCKPQAGISFGSAGDSAGGGVEYLKVFGNTLYNNSASIQIQNADSSTNLIKGNIFRGETAIEGKVGSNVFASNITADPLFANAAAGNFQLQAGSPAVDAGAEAIGSLDLAGNPRVSGARVDAGAFEHQQGSTTATAPTTTTTTQPTATTTTTTATSTQPATTISNEDTSSSSEDTYISRRAWDSRRTTDSSEDMASSTDSVAVATSSESGLASITSSPMTATNSLDSVAVVLGDSPVEFDADMGTPFIDSNSRTLVPFRAVLEKYGCRVQWKATEKIAVAKMNGIEVQVPIGESYVLVNGVKKINDTTAQIKEGRTYLPIRIVLESFGASVSWDASTKTVLVD